MNIEQNVDDQISLAPNHNGSTRLKAQPSTTVRSHRDFLGSFVGILAFLGGVGLLLLVFKLAYEMFNTPPGKALSIEAGKKLDLNTGVNSLLSVFIRILLLLVMGLVGSWIANRGISLYTQARSLKVNVEEH